MARPPPATLLETKSLLDGVALGAIATPSNHYELHLGRLLTSARVPRSALSTPRNVYQSTLWWLSVQKDWMRLLITLKSKWYGYFDHFRFEIVLCNIRHSFLSIIDVQPPWEKSTKLPSLRKYLHPTRTHAPPPICHYIRQQPKRDSFFDSPSDEGSMGATIGWIRTIFHLGTVIRSFRETRQFIKDISFSRFINDSALSFADDGADNEPRRSQFDYVLHGGRQRG